MKKYIIIFILSFFVIVSFNSCNLMFDQDTTNEISMLSIKPVIALNGDPIMEMTQGSTYTEEGVSAYAGDTLLDYRIISGNVKPDTEGFYVVTYEASNGFGWSSIAYRAVLVHDGTPYADDITGNMTIGFQFTSSLSKHTINGYWDVSNVFSQQGVSFPIVIADEGDGINYGIVPGEHPTKGKYRGYAVRSSSSIQFFLTITSPEGKVTQPDFTWQI